MHKKNSGKGAAIKSAKRPLLLVGAGANRKEARRAISEFIGMIGIPTICRRINETNTRHRKHCDQTEWQATP